MKKSVYTDFEVVERKVSEYIKRNKEILMSMNISSGYKKLINQVLSRVESKYEDNIFSKREYVEVDQLPFKENTSEFNHIFLEHTGSTDNCRVLESVKLFPNFGIEINYITVREAGGEI